MGRVVVEHLRPQRRVTGRLRTVETPHLAALDGLRGIAIVMVVWYHLWEISWLPADVGVGAFRANFNVFPETGSAGVDLFFFISGFCLFYPYARTVFDGAPAQSLATFAWRRVIKIVPSYYFALVVLIAVGYARFGSPSEALLQIGTHVTFIHNLFADTWGGIDGVMWSLATEVQFYVAFPVVCWCALRRPLLTFAALIAAGNAYRFAVAGNPDVFHVLDRLPGTIDLFACGMLAAWLYRAIATRRPRLAARTWLWTAVALLAIAAIYVGLRFQFEHRYDRNWSVLWKITFRPLFDCALLPLTVGSLLGARTWQRVLANPAFVGLSFVSYNLYLWHQPVATMLASARWLPFAARDLHGDHARGLAFTLVAFVLATAVAWTITVAVEQPILRRGKALRFTASMRARLRES